MPASGQVSYKLKVSANVTASDFYFKETKAPDGYEIDNSGQITPGSNVPNTPQTGSLTVTKTVTHNSTTSQAPDPKATFEITVKLGNSDTPVPVTGNTVTFAGNGTYKFTLGNNGKATIQKIPIGTAYSVSEPTPGAGYTVTYTNKTGTTSTTTVNATVTNTYFEAKDITWTPQVRKTVTGSGYDPNQQFIFTLTETDSNWVAKEGGTTKSVKAKAGETKSFDSISYTDAAVGTHYYTVKETDEGVFGFDYDTAVHHITVVIGKAADGTLTRTVTVDAGAPNSNEPITTVPFSNTYRVNSTFWAPQVQKTVVTADGGIPDPKLNERQFIFDLSCNTTDGVTLPDTKTVTISGSEIDKPKAFQDVTFTKAGTYIFTITETGTGSDHYTPQEASKTITVVVAQSNNRHDLVVSSVTNMTNNTPADHITLKHGQSDYHQLHQRRDHGGRHRRCCQQRGIQQQHRHHHHHGGRCASDRPARRRCAHE